MPKRTYKPSKRSKLKTHGFRSRSDNKTRRKVIKKRILKGRKRTV